VLDIEFLIEFRRSTINELSTAVSDDNMWYAETTYYILPNKILNIPCCNHCQEFDRYPLSEIVNFN